MRGRGEGSIRQRHRADGSVYWEARARIDGRQLSFYAATKTKARAQARQARSDAERGRLRSRSTITVEEWLREWLSYAKDTVRPRTYKDYRSVCENHVIPAIGRTPVHQLTPSDVERVLVAVHERGRAIKTVRNVRGVMVTAFHRAQRDIGLMRNPAALAQVPRARRPSFTPETVSPSQAQDIIAAFEGSRLEPLVLFSIATGVRQGEALALRWSDIDEKYRSVTIRQAVDISNGKRTLTRLKSESSHRAIRLPQLAMRALELSRELNQQYRLLAGTEWREFGLVFPGPNGDIRNGSTVTHNFQKRLASRGMEPIRWHALRRVFAALLQDAGVPLERVRDLMGHSQLQVTEHYAYTLTASLLRDMDSIDEALHANSGDLESDQPPHNTASE